ncbi:guanylate kinase [bacterium]|nr:MAG: guanylate kinase [bacterium]
MKGNIFVISGPSGVGKTTLVKKVKKVVPGLWISVSATTRPKRKGERHGIDYYFLSEEEFRKKIEEGYFLEYAKVFHWYYGTPKEPIYEQLEQGVDVILEIDVQGGEKLMEIFPHGVFIFILPPSWKALEERIKGRKTEGKEVIKMRLERAREELRYVERYTHVVVNNHLDTAIRDISYIIKADRLRKERMKETIRRLNVHTG